LPLPDQERDAKHSESKGRAQGVEIGVGGEAGRQRKTSPRSHCNGPNELRWPSSRAIAIWA